MWKGYCPDLDQVRVLGKKEDVSKPVMVKFAELKDKEKLLYETVDLPPGIKMEDLCISSSCNEIEQVQNDFLKYCVGAPEHCCNMISRVELGKYLIESTFTNDKILFMIGCDILNDTFKFVTETDSQ